MRQNTLRYAIYSVLAIAAFFLLMKLVGMENVAGLRVFNLVIVVYFMNRLARKNLMDDPDLNYVEGLGSLMMANVLTVVASVIGFIAYVRLFDPDFLNNHKAALFWLNNDTSLWRTVVSLFMEGMAGAIIVSFTLMQYWKDQRNTLKTKG
ncbi:MAG: hypothetical protein K0R65_2578 [Crocinitomicaceae bacterium]|jgi:hypothetical protein|nr:hypothetical protein [Crocinitomicaceae bacterium]